MNMNQKRIVKNKRQEIWIGANTFKGMALIYIRTYAIYGDSPEMRPTKDGISIKAELYSSLLEAILQLGKTLTP